MPINAVDKNNSTEAGKDPLFIILMVLFVIGLIVTVGTIGYHIFGEIEWIDAFYNGALVFTATTVVTPVKTYQGKIFSAFYNLFSAIFVLVLLGVIFRGAINEADFIGTSDDNIDDIDDNICKICGNTCDKCKSRSNVFEYYSI